MYKFKIKCNLSFQFPDGNVCSAPEPAIAPSAVSPPAAALWLTAQFF